MRDRPGAGLAAFMAVAGTMHFVAPQLYDPLIPDALGEPRPWVIWSGVAELACAAAVAVPRTRAVGAWATAALFVAVFPGNVQMAVDAWHSGSTTEKVLTTARLPLQVPLVWWAVHVARAQRR